MEGNSISSDSDDDNGDDVISMRDFYIADDPPDYDIALSMPKPSYEEAVYGSSVTGSQFMESDHSCHNPVFDASSSTDSENSASERDHLSVEAPTGTSRHSHINESRIISRVCDNSAQDSVTIEMEPRDGRVTRSNARRIRMLDMVREARGMQTINETPEQYSDTELPSYEQALEILATQAV